MLSALFNGLLIPVKLRAGQLPPGPCAACPLSTHPAASGWTSRKNQTPPNKSMPRAPLGPQDLATFREWWWADLGPAWQRKVAQVQIPSRPLTSYVTSGQ